MKATTQYAHASHQIDFHPIEAAITGAMFMVMSVPSGIQVWNTATAKPCRLFGNHRLMAVGPATPMKPMPQPSITRETSSISKLVDNAPISDPTNSEITETAKDFFNPKRYTSPVAGKAKIKPMMENTDMIQP